MKIITFFVSMIFISQPIIAQDFSTYTILGDVEELNRLFDEDSISLYDGGDLIASFDYLSDFALNLGYEITGKGYSLLYDDMIFHIILNKSINKGSMRIGIFKKKTGSRKYELINKYIDVIKNNSLSFLGVPISIEFFDTSIMIVTETRYEYRFFLIPDFQTDTLEVFQLEFKIKKQ